MDSDREIPDSIRHLAGITKLAGYVADADARDIILVGKTNHGLPELHLEDLVIALRNVWNLYAQRHGQVIERSDPGCSIDPNPTVLSELRNLQSAVFSAHGREQVEPLLTQYKEIAESPQKVRVLGVPYDTRFASTMVTADYDMKRIVDGSDNLELQGFQGLMDRMLARAKADMLAGGSTSIPGSMMNRFWFYPGSNTYVESEGVVLIKTCPVALLTEEQHLNHGGTAVEGTGAANPYAKQFADDFTDYYDRIAEKRPIYTELQNLYRFVALAKILKHKSAIAQSGADLDYLFESYAVPHTHVSRRLPGRYNLKTFEHRIDYDNGYETMRAWLPSCGGVGISIVVDRNNFVHDENQIAESTARKVIEFRPNTDTLAWGVPPACRLVD